MPGDLLTQLEGSVESMVSRIGRTLEDRAERAATSVGTMIVLALVAGLSAGGLLAAAVVALAEPLGVAGALAVVNGSSLLLCGAVWTLRRRATKAPDPAPAPPVEIPQPAPPPAAAEPPPRLDPVFLTAAAAASVALIGPRRIVRAAAFAADGLRAAESVLLALDLASHAASVRSLLNDLTRGHAAPPPPPPPPSPPAPAPRPPTVVPVTADPVEPSPSSHLAGLD